MSMVLVITGLIIGGALVGADMVNAATIRAQITQIDKYNTAVHVFEAKYNYLPGDIKEPYASNFGFQARGVYAGEGDGDGVIESNCNNTAGNNHGTWEGCGELAVFWEDLSTTGLIDITVYGYDTKGNGYPDIRSHYSDVTSTSSPALKDWLPPAKVAKNNFVYIYSGGGINYFTVSSITKIGWNMESSLNPGITVQQAYRIDSKIDDGLPQSGTVTACYQNYLVSNSPTNIWAAGNNLQGANAGTVYLNGQGTNCTATTAATPYLSTNCFDNSNVSGAVQTYSLTQNAKTQNCALSFQFQ